MKKRYILMILILMLYWAAAGIEETIRRLGLFPGTSYEKIGVVLGFAITGLISFLFLLFFWQKSTSKVAKAFIVLGYFSITPIAYLFGMAGMASINMIQKAGISKPVINLFFTPLLIGFFGSIPVMGNTLVGATIGRLASYLYYNYIADK